MTPSRSILVMAAWGVCLCATVAVAQDAKPASGPTEQGAEEFQQNYDQGIAYLKMNPPKYLDGFWALARAVTSKSATEAQSKQAKAYLRKVLSNYQQCGCESLIEPQLNQLLTLAPESPARPDTFKFPSTAELNAARREMTLKSFLEDVKAGGDRANLSWIAACGLEFPGVPSKVIEVGEGDPVILKVAFVGSDEEFKSATDANMEVKVEGQPEAARVRKGEYARFTGRLVSYDASPLLVRWDKAKVNAEDIPKEKK